MSADSKRDRVDGFSQGNDSRSTGSRQNASSASSESSKIHPLAEFKNTELKGQDAIDALPSLSESGVDHRLSSPAQQNTASPRRRPQPFLRRVQSERIYSPSVASEDGQELRGLASNSLLSGFSDLRKQVQQLRAPGNKLAQFLTSVDLDTIDQLDKNFNRSFEKRKLQEEAKRLAIRQNLVIVAAAMIAVQAAAIVILIYRGGLSVPDAILFALYTTTTAGFGSVEIPFDSDFLIFVIIFVFVALAMLTMLVAEVYMYLAIQTSAAKKNRDQDALHHLKRLQEDGPGRMEKLAADPELAAVSNKIHAIEANHTGRGGHTVIFRGLWRALNACKAFYRRSELGRLLIVVLYLGSLLLSGSIGMMILEDWTFTEALYFSTFVMTSVGYGDFAPTKNSSTWFVIAWITFNVSFVSIYMGNLSRHYRMLCKANADRLYKRMYEEHLGTETPLAGGEENQDSDAKHSDNEESLQSTKFQSFKDLHDFVLKNAVVNSISWEVLEKTTSKDTADLMTITAVHSSRVFDANQARIPSFTILVLVQERVAQIIAHDVAGCQSDIVAKDTTLAVSFDDILETARQWMIPDAAREAFCQSAFEAILYVGECKLVNFGADALTKLPPRELFDILSPFLAAMSDAGSMAGWLACTEEIASIKFPRASI